ncbi:MAG TPA: 5'/3'-nucleotidase SurE [Planctomycetaceae bacterium]|nr:5'/3'-nucleotidase SurE [Planctomycetaceae bacterium]
MSNADTIIGLTLLWLVQILLTNDDGIYAPGLAALEHELRQLGDVTVVAPSQEQSGVSQSITFLRPLVCTAVERASGCPAWTVDGTPADCVKIGLFECCRQRPQLIVSGINGGLNAGINVLYSGTVAAAIEGSTFGIRSIAVSLEQAAQPAFETAAGLARKIIKQLVDQATVDQRLFNVNIPTAALAGSATIRVVPMSPSRYGDQFIKRQDPKGRDYFWATTDPPPQDADQETDLLALQQGCVTVTPLQYNMTDHKALTAAENWNLTVDNGPQ